MTPEGVPYYVIEGPQGVPIDSRKLTMTEMAMTISIPEAGRKYYGLSRNASYEAAKRGEIPTINVGRLKRVPVRAMERIFDFDGRSRRR